MKLEAGIPAREGPDVSRCWKNNALLLNIILDEEKARCSVTLDIVTDALSKGPWIDDWLGRRKDTRQFRESSYLDADFHLF